MKYIAYVAGPYRADTVEARDANIAAADAVGRALVTKGYAVFIPHNNTRHWEEDGRFSHEDCIDIDLAILERCDLLVVVGDYTASAGTRREIDWARRNGIPVYLSVDAVPPPEQFRPDVTCRLVQALFERRRAGVSTYGAPLTAGSGIRTLHAALEEALDLSAYILAEIERG